MKLYIREGVLKDISEEGEEPRYTDIQLNAYARWACAELSQHTAKADLYTYDGNGKDNMFPLPPDIVGSIEQEGLVLYKDDSSTNFLSPYDRLPDVKWSTANVGDLNKQVYWEWPSGTLSLAFTPKENSKIVLNYFRIWPVPDKDTDLLSIPQWMEQPFVYLVAAAAMEPLGAQAANIRTWNRRQDSGNPEHNPAQKQAKWFVEQAYRILARFPVQSRSSFYRNDPRKPGR